MYNSQFIRIGNMIFNVDKIIGINPVLVNHGKKYKTAVDGDGELIGRPQSYSLKVTLENDTVYTLYYPTKEMRDETFNWLNDALVLRKNFDEVK